MKDWSDIKTKEQLKKRYASYLPSLMKIANRCGYALSLHGSMTRDLDLIAAPWVKNAMAPESLVITLEKSLLGYSRMRSYWKNHGDRDSKPHGRRAYIIPFAILADDFEVKNWRMGIIDLSVMPRK